jgi:hypothetical protein
VVIQNENKKKKEKKKKREKMNAFLPAPDDLS